VSTKTEIIKLFKEYKPKTAKEARNIGLSLTRLASGAFREVYAINKQDSANRLVVKFPISGASKEGNLEHARHEIYVIRKITRIQKFAALRPFIPAMYYADTRNGVLLTDYYHKVGQSKAVFVGHVLQQVADAIFDDEGDDRDIAGYNIMQTREGEFKIIDLGLL